MPKEIVKDVTDNQIEVCWSSAGHVQLAVRHPENYFTFLLKEEGEQEQYDALFTTLDRWQINQIIKKLRRARDAAFGADE